MSVILPFEKLAYFITGIRCEASPRGIAVRVLFGVVATAAVVSLGLVFFGAAAGNANAAGWFPLWLLFAAGAFLAYVAGTFWIWRAGRAQLAQYVAWAPLMFVAAAGTVSFVFALGS